MKKGRSGRSGPFPWGRDAAQGSGPAGACRLHPVVDRALTALRSDPHDVLCGVLDVAGLAVNAVLRIDLQAILAVVVLDELVHHGGAIARLRAAVFGQVDRDRYRYVLDRTVNRLIFLVVRVRDEHRAQAIEGDLAIGLGVLDARTLRGRLQTGVVGHLAVNGPGHLALEQPLFDAGHHRGHGATLLERLLEVAS